MSNSIDADGPWSVQHARNLYNIHRWGANYFDINEAGRVVARPLGDTGAAVDLTEVIEEAKARGLKKLALFGTRFTMQGTFYPKVFSREGIELVMPDAKEQDYLHDKYLNELVPGKFLSETRAGLLAIVDRMKAKSNIDGVILAGTELPLILRDADHNGIPFLNTTKIHVEAAVTELLS